MAHHQKMLPEMFYTRSYPPFCICLAIVILLWFKLADVSCSLSNIYRSASKKNAVFYLIAHDKLMNTPLLWQGMLASDDDCLIKCLLESRCKSISAKDISNQGIICFLHAVDRGTQELVVANGFRYYDAGYLQRKIGPVCRSRSTPCNGTICIDNLRGSFQCNFYPGKSCKKIKKQFGHVNLASGFYDVLFQGRKYQIYCDMETLGGGWQLIGKAEVNKLADTHGILRKSVTDLLNSSQNTFIPSKGVFKILKDFFGFSQLRFYCYKSSKNKVVHIVTTNNSTGTQVVEYFAGQKDTTPTACGSYEMLEDDNSYLSRHCKNWNNGNLWFVAHLHSHPMFISGKVHFGLVRDRPECDDFYTDENFDLNGVWKFFAR